MCGFPPVHGREWCSPCKYRIIPIHQTLLAQLAHTTRATLTDIDNPFTEQVAQFQAMFKTHTSLWILDFYNLQDYKENKLCLAYHRNPHLLAQQLTGGDSFLQSSLPK